MVYGLTKLSKHKIEREFSQGRDDVFFFLAFFKCHMTPFHINQLLVQVGSKSMIPN